MTKWLRYLLPASLIVVGFLLIGAYWLNNRPVPISTAIAVTVTATPEPIRPTRTPIPTDSPATATPTPLSTPTPASPPTDTPVPTAVAIALQPDEHARFGISGKMQDVQPALDAGLPFVTFLDWAQNLDIPAGLDVWQMIRLNEEGIMFTSYEVIDAVLSAHPGSVWIIGNEPDVLWQDNVTPEQYARHYHELHTYIKERDPSARVAPAGVAQPTPLRLAYLEIVLDTYEAEFGEPLPVDLWTIHAFILREEQDSWGVGIPPGMAEQADNGRLYEISDHNDIEIFRQFLVDFRRWMKENGYQDVPLAITEFGILMPNDYGFPPETVAEWMRQTFAVLQSETDAEIGYPTDNGRLVQYWFWYSLRDAPDYYPTGDLFVRETGQLTLLGETYRDYINGE